jgi:hypothetical protein
LAAFERGGRHRLDSPAARVILAAAPTPAAAEMLTVAELAALLRTAGRQRGITAEADKLHAVLNSEQMRQPAPVEQAMGLHLQGLLRQLDAICQTLQQLEQVDPAGAPAKLAGQNTFIPLPLRRYRRSSTLPRGSSWTASTWPHPPRRGTPPLLSP